jgi:hypothetical protein
VLLNGEKLGFISSAVADPLLGGAGERGSREAVRNDFSVVQNEFLVGRNDFWMVPNDFSVVQNDFWMVPNDFSVVQNDF